MTGTSPAPLAAAVPGEGGQQASTTTARPHVGGPAPQQQVPRGGGQAESPPAAAARRNRSPVPSQGPTRPSEVIPGFAAPRLSAACLLSPPYRRIITAIVPNRSLRPRSGAGGGPGVQDHRGGGRGSPVRQAAVVARTVRCGRRGRDRAGPEEVLPQRPRRDSLSLPPAPALRGAARRLCSFLFIYSHFTSWGFSGLFPQQLFFFAFLSLTSCARACLCVSRWGRRCSVFALGVLNILGKRKESSQKQFGGGDLNIRRRD